LHRACAQAVQGLKAPLITCEAVIAESCYLLRNLPGAPEAVIENIAAGIFQIPFQLSQESTRVKHVLRKYRDRSIDHADACLICLADEFGTGDILTLDQDFKLPPFLHSSILNSPKYSKSHQECTVCEDARTH
jgi:predicted nucleic acid-binding protein